MRGRILSGGVLLVLAILLLSGASTPRTPTPASAPIRTASAPAGAYFDHVVVLLMENHAICDVLTYCGGRGTYETQLSNGTGLATGYVSCGTSLLNYLCLTAASTFGCQGNYDPNSNNCTALAWQAPNIVDRLVAANLTWKAYMENMTSDCLGVNDAGYVVRHDPFVYYGDIVNNASRCAQVVPAGANDGALLNDLADPSTAPNYMWLTPDICDDMDKCPLETGDAFLSGLVPQILNSPTFTSSRSALFLTFDEPSGGRGAPSMYTIWAGPVAKIGYTSDVPYGHFSFLSTLEANWGLAPLTANDSAASNMTEFFVGPQASFSLSAFPWNVAFQTTQNATSTITLHGYNGFNGKVDLSETSVPAGVTTTCSPTSIHNGGSSTCTMTAGAAGSYEVNVTGASAKLTANASIDADVYDPLVSRFTVSPASPFTGQAVNFTGKGTGGTQPYNYSWDFGDGSTANGARVTHIFTTAGSYNVVLTLLDSIGVNASAAHGVTVAPAAPVASTAAATGIGDSYATLEGDLTSLGQSATVGTGFLLGTDPNLVGAANESAGSASAPGGFSLLVSGLLPSTQYAFQAWADGVGFSAGTILSFTTAGVAPAPLVAALTATPTSPTVGTDVSFAATASGGVSPYTYAWQFGDGTTGGGMSVVHRFAATGAYQVNLTVSDPAGHSATASIDVVVVPLPLPTSISLLAGNLGNSGWYTSAVVVTITASDPRGPAVWVDYAVDGGAWVNYTGAFTLRDGRHTVAYAASDAYGGMPETRHYANVSVDTLAPDLDVSAPGNVESTSTVTIHWSSLDNGSGLEGFQVEVDIGGFESVGLATNVTLSLADGLHTITVRAQDAAGNTVTQSITVLVDTNPLSVRHLEQWLPWVAVLIAIAVVLVGFVVWRRRRKRS